MRGKKWREGKLRWLQKKSTSVCSAISLPVCVFFIILLFPCFRVLSLVSSLFAHFAFPTCFTCRSFYLMGGADFMFPALFEWMME